MGDVEVGLDVTKYHTLMIKSFKRASSLPALQKALWIPPNIPQSRLRSHIVQGVAGIIQASSFLFKASQSV